MTRHEFEGFVRMVFTTASDWRGEPGIYWLYGDETRYSVSWITGGMCGGNCWGDNADHPVTSEDEPEMDKLDQLLEEVCPRMTIKQYRQLLADVVYRESRTNWEYYGNYTTYSEKYVVFDHLYEWLRDHGHI